MKKVTCADLGGPANDDFVIEGSTAEEMAENCKKYVMEQVQAGSQAHIDAVQAMMALSPEEQQKKFAEYMQICEDSLTEA